MNASESAPAEPCPRNRAETAAGRLGPRRRRAGRRYPPSGADPAEIMPAVRRVMLGLAIGADLFLHRLRDDSPSFVPEPDSENDPEPWAAYLRDRKNAHGRVEWQRCDSVEAARLAGVLGRLLRSCPPDPDESVRPRRRAAKGRGR